MSGHDRRPKEAAQLGAYHSMLTGRTGYFIDSRGVRRTITEALRMGIVTFCPDGTWAMHEVDVDEANTAYELALAMRHQSKVSTLYAGKAIKSDTPPEWQAELNARLMEAITRIPADAPELGQLMQAWKAAGLPKASEGAVPPERFGEAMCLIHEHGSAWQPFPDAKVEEKTADIHVWAKVAERWRALPVDLRDACSAQGAHLPAITKTLVSEAEAEDWERLVSLAEVEHECRTVEVAALLGFVSDLEYPVASLAHELMVREFGPVDGWTKRDLELASAIWDCCTTTDLVAEDGRLIVRPRSAATYEANFGGKRAVVAAAKQAAQNFGLTPAPKKWDDLIGSPVLYAAVLAA